jgi:hypothetical protein
MWLLSLLAFHILYQNQTRFQRGDVVFTQLKVCHFNKKHSITLSREQRS